MSGEFPDWVKNKHNEVLIERRLEESRALQGELKKVVEAAKAAGALEPQPSWKFHPRKFEESIEAEVKTKKLKLADKDMVVSELSYRHPETAEAMIGYSLRADSLLRNRTDLGYEGPLVIVILPDTEGNISDLEDVIASCSVDREWGGAPTLVIMDSAFALKDANS